MKSVVISGSTRGIGRGLAREFIARGCKVMVSGRSQQAVDAAVAKLSQGADVGSVLGRSCEISDASEVERLWDEAKQAFGRVDIWINNAGTSTRSRLEDASASDIERVIQVNLTGLLLASSVALRGMQAQGGGQIWNMEGFGSGGQTALGMSVYGASKSAVSYLNKALAKEVSGSKVQVCALSPGIVATDLLKGDYDPDSPEWEKARRIFNILGDKVETVAPFLVDGVLRANKNGDRVAWLTRRKAFLRFLTAAFNRRDLFADSL